MNTTTTHPFTDSVTGYQDPADPNREPPLTAPADIKPGDTFLHPFAAFAETFTVEEIMEGVILNSAVLVGEHRALRFRSIRGDMLVLFLDEKVEVVF